MFKSIIIFNVNNKNVLIILIDGPQDEKYVSM